jgi:hypothetical protein
MSFNREEAADNFKCNFCAKSYSSKSKRDKHEKGSHKDERDKKSSSDAKYNKSGDISYGAKFKYGD